MKNLIKEQIKKIRKIKNYNSSECIKELNTLNTYICESELDLKCIKHLPSELDEKLDKLEKEIKWKLS